MLSLSLNELAQVHLSFDLRGSSVQFLAIVLLCLLLETKAVLHEIHSLDSVRVSIESLFYSFELLGLMNSFLWI